MSKKLGDEKICLTCQKAFFQRTKTSKYCSGICVKRRPLSEEFKKEMVVRLKGIQIYAFRTKEIIIEKFMNRVDKSSNECWEWTGSKKDTGYGRFYYNDTLKSVKAHRASYMLFVGEIEEGLHVLHKCDNPSCVNPEHLSLGTHRENMDDMVSKGRTPGLKGSLNGFSKLNEEQIIKIKELHIQGHSRNKIARLFGVSGTSIGNILKNKRWTHVV